MPGVELEADVLPVSNLLEAERLEQALARGVRQRGPAEDVHEAHLLQPLEQLARRAASRCRGRAPPAPDRSRPRRTSGMRRARGTRRVGVADHFAVLLGDEPHVARGDPLRHLRGRGRLLLERDDRVRDERRVDRGDGRCVRRRRVANHAERPSPRERRARGGRGRCLAVRAHLHQPRLRGRRTHLVGRRRGAVLHARQRGDLRQVDAARRDHVLLERVAGAVLGQRQEVEDVAAAVVRAHDRQLGARRAWRRSARRCRAAAPARP